MQVALLFPPLQLSFAVVIRPRASFAVHCAADAGEVVMVAKENRMTTNLVLTKSSQFENIKARPLD
jgi:hypothetical protein